MGCSSSLNLPTPGDNTPMEYSNTQTDTQADADRLFDTNTQMHICEKDKNTKHKMKPEDNIHFNNTRILIFSRDTRDKDSTDTSSVVPIFNEHDQMKTRNSTSPCLTPCSTPHSARSGRESRSISIPGGIKSVLKTGRHDPRDHMLANRPIKTVTFVESVTVVTVY